MLHIQVVAIGIPKAIVHRAIAVIIITVAALSLTSGCGALPVNCAGIVFTTDVHARATGSVRASWKTQRIGRRSQGWVLIVHPTVTIIV